MRTDRQYLWIISLDGLAGDDWDTFMALPHFQEFMSEAAYCRHVYSIYPSVTYPAHTTIVTGRYPCHHGIENNTLYQPKRAGHEDWNWYSRKIKGTTLFDLIYEKGLDIASYLWPVNAGNMQVRYNMPEIFANRKWDNQIFTSMRSGTKIFQIKSFLRYGHLMDGIKEPALDNFVHEVVLHTAVTRSPEVQFIHYSDLDSTRHTYGHDSEEAHEAIRRHDVRLGELMDLVRREGVWDQTSWVLLGDHSSIDEHTALYLNVFFRQAGIPGARTHSADGSAYVHLEHPQDADEVAEKLMKFSKEHDHCIEKIYNREQAHAFGAGECDLMLEARRGYYFLDTTDGHEVMHLIQDDEIGKVPGLTRSTHGYHPYKKNYQTFFAMRGNMISPGEKEGPMHLVDDGPTIAKLLGLALPDADGVVRSEFFR